MAENIWTPDRATTLDLKRDITALLNSRLARAAMAPRREENEAEKNRLRQEVGWGITEYRHGPGLLSMDPVIEGQDPVELSFYIDATSIDTRGRIFMHGEGSYALDKGNLGLFTLATWNTDLSDSSTPWAQFQRSTHGDLLLVAPINHDTPLTPEIVNGFEDHLFRLNRLADEYAKTNPE